MWVLQRRVSNRLLRGCREFESRFGGGFSCKTQPSPPLVKTQGGEAMGGHERNHQKKFWSSLWKTADDVPTPGMAVGRKSNLKWLFTLLYFTYSDGQFIVAGSDDGSIFIWDRQSTNNIRILKGDASIVNCLQPHPSYCMLATSGIEHVVRIWTPMPEVIQTWIFSMEWWC